MTADPDRIKVPEKLRTNEGFNPANAFWCEEHHRLECVQKKKGKRWGEGNRNNDARCHNLAIKGTQKCRIHPGQRVAVAKAKGASLINAWSVIGDSSKAVDYKIAVLGVLQMTWLRLNLYSEMLRKQIYTAEYMAGRDQNDLEEIPVSIEITGEGEVNVKGLIGHRYGMGGKDGIVYVQNEEVRALVKLEAEERDRVVKYAKVAHDMGITDRLASLAEKWVDIAALRVSLLLDELDLTPAQQKAVPALLVKHLSSIEVGSMTSPS